MSAHTGIQYCDCTVNPVMGCGGCELHVPGRGGPCYAGCDHERKGQVNSGFAPMFLLPTLFPERSAKIARLPDLTGTERREKPWLNGMPRLIFVSDMGDALSDTLFGDDTAPGHHVWSRDVITTVWGKDKNGRPVPKERLPREGSIREGGVPFDFLKTEIVDVARGLDGRRHHWLWLTKRPERMARFSRWLRDEHNVSWPSNLWAGTSVTGSGTLWQAHELIGVGDISTLRYISVEPQWNEVSLLDVFAERPDGRWWVISGGESFQRKESMPNKFDLGWVRNLRDECGSFGVPFFLKQLGGNPRDTAQPWPLRKDPKHGGNWNEWPVDLRIREMPRV